MKYAVVVPYAYRPYFNEFVATLKVPRENCLFVDDTDPAGGIGIMRAHNMGIDFAKEKSADYLIVMSAGIRFGEAGGLDFIKAIEEHPDLLVINGAGRVTFDGEAEQVIAMGYHLTAFKMDIFHAIGRWDENFTPYGFDDIDLMLRMKKYFGSEYKVDSIPVDMEHVRRSHSIELAKVEAPSAPRIAYFVEKWGRHPGAWQWDGYVYPFNNPAHNLAYWPPAPNGGRCDDIEQATEQGFWLNEATLDDIAGKPPVSLKASLRAIVPEISPAVNTGKVLDVGCGPGRLAIPMQKEFKKAQVIGIDISPQFLKIARDKKTSAQFILGDRVPAGPLDAAYSMLVFQHIPDPAKLSYILRVGEALKPGGIFRFQFVLGDRPPLPNRHETTMRTIKRYCAESRLEVIKVDEGLMHPQWVWITARKPGAA